MSDYQKLVADELALKLNENKIGFEAAGEEKLRSFITEICSAVLSEALGETEEGTQNVGIWPRTIDGARSDIRMKTEFRKASDFEKNFYKLFANSLIVHADNSQYMRHIWVTCMNLDTQ